MMALALQSDEEGMVMIDKDVLSAETGYNKVTIAYTIADLCRLTFNNHRVLVPCNQNSGDIASSQLSYVLFPSNERKVYGS
ncbi:MAG: hypothetical protein M3430_19650 [Acidobacteriota bacterium]|nr:hypothetical protein [Acidobacteriota bacterium]